ncbi:hypothetical protein AMTR_s00041p00138920, partial [Amborella trichopoda]
VWDCLDFIIFLPYSKSTYRSEHAKKGNPLKNQQSKKALRVETAKIVRVFLCMDLSASPHRKEIDEGEQAFSEPYFPSHPTTSEHELLELPVCTDSMCPPIEKKDSMYPPIHE